MRILSLADKLERAVDNCYVRSDGKTIHIIPINRSKSKGIPLPSSYNISNWHAYVAKYDPFNWDGKHKDPRIYTREKINEQKRMSKLRRNVGDELQEED